MSRELSRRNMLAAMGLAGAAAVSLPVLSACGVGGKTNAPNGAGEVSGGFDWKKASGSTINVLQTPHPYQKSYQPLLKEFTQLTGINVNVDLVPEADYFTKLNTELAGGSGKHDAFMLGAYFIWQYGPAGWIENLDPWLKNSSATGPDYDFEDIFEGLRTSTRWDFTTGNPLGTGGQWAIPWGFENNVVAYNKKYFDQRGIKKLPDRFDDFIQLAVDLTDRSQNRYGIATRGSKSWATIHPGFMTQYVREGAVDYTFNGSDLVAEMDSDKAIAFTEHFELDQQTLFNITRTATHGIEPHDFLSRTLHYFFRNLLHRSHLFVSRVETAVSIEIADHGERRVTNIAVHGAHVELPLEMFS